MPWQSRRVAAFLCRFIILFLVLSPPLQWWDRAYGSFFRSVGTAIFVNEDDARRELSFTTPGADSLRPLDTRIEIANRALLHPDGSGPVRDLDLDARAFAWDPMALLAALTLATPIPWGRKLWALLWGTLSLHVIILLCLSFSIWYESAEVGLVNLTPFWRSIAGTLTDLIVTQARLALPPLVWILATFRREDWKTFRASQPLPGTPSALART